MRSNMLLTKNLHIFVTNGANASILGIPTFISFHLGRNLPLFAISKSIAFSEKTTTLSFSTAE